MSAPPALPQGLPQYVKKDDGRLEPFDGDRICQALFAATEARGQPDAFLARDAPLDLAAIALTPATVAAKEPFLAAVPFHAPRGGLLAIDAPEYLLRTADADPELLRLLSWASARSREQGRLVVNLNMASAP